MDILKKNLQESAEKLAIKDDFIFQQDNDPKHTARIVKEYLLYHVPRRLQTPPQSPDLNPIEHLWEKLEKNIRKYNITSKNDLICKLKEEWAKITPSDTEKLVHSMKKRLQAVIKHKGYPTKY